MGIELHPIFLSLTEQRRYQPLRKSIVAKWIFRGMPIADSEVKPITRSEVKPIRNRRLSEYF